jgi:hypothetical protein
MKTSPHQARYRTFRELLARNGTALAQLAELEQAYYGARPFSAGELGKRCRTLLESTRALVADFEQLAGATSAAELAERCDRIDAALAAALGRADQVKGPLVLPLEELGPGSEPLAGAKATNLAIARSRAGARVPAGFVVTAAAWRLLLDENRLGDLIDEELAGADGASGDDLEARCRRLQDRVLGARIPDELRAEMLAAFDALAGSRSRLSVAVRSSAVGEDTDASFAGQYLTVLEVERHGLLEAYRRVAASIAPAQLEDLSSYALVSEDYLNLSARFGYHYANLVSLCGAVADQNYISLQFSGGVGSYDGRALRAEFVARVLAKLGFEVKLAGDLVEASLRTGLAAQIEERLEQLARLLASTRLLDVSIRGEAHLDRMVEMFFAGDYDFLAQAQHLDGFYVLTGNWSRHEDAEGAFLVQDGTGWAGSGRFPRFMRRLVGDRRYQDFLDSIKAYHYFPKVIVKDGELEEGAVSVEVRPMGGFIDRAGGIAFGLRDAASYFVLRINALENNLVLFEHADGERHQRLTVDRAIEAERWYRLTLSLSGRTVRGSLDGELLVEHEAARPLGGYVGLWTKADSVTHFRRLRVESAAGRRELP